ncbi:MAG TPA: Crp/Fnr family transcriptional regulator [Draconibacterium sp.]|nr:Crp/Fnr family transcriptional regulator [Draconibacterium sp.]
MIKHQIECKSCSNTECLIRKHCADQGIEPYLARKVSIPARKGQSIIIEGSPIHGLYFLFSGKVKVLTTGINGREQILRFAKAGEILGQRGFNTHQYSPIGASALEDSVVCNFSVEVMKEMLHNLPKLAYDFISFYAEELHRSETKVRMFAHMTVREKVIDALLYINRKFGHRKNYIAIQLSRKEIADFAGTTEEQVIRVLSTLKKEELISLSVKKIGITDINRLKKEIAEHHYFIQS